MLEPDGRRVRLTEAARLLLSHAHQIFTHLEHAESDLAAFRRGDAGTVRLGTFSSAVKAIAVPVISDLATRTRTCGSRSARWNRRTRWTRLLSRHRRRVADALRRARHCCRGQDDQRLVHRAPAGRRRWTSPCRSTTRSPIGRRSNSPIWPTPTGSSPRPGVPCQQLTLGGLRPGRFRAARPALRGRIHRRGRACRRGTRRQAAAPARPGGVHHRADRAAPGRRVSPIRRIGVQIRAGTGDQPHIAPVLDSLRRVAGQVARGPVECRAGPDRPGRRAPA